jgi:hypothetical protein
MTQREEYKPLILIYTEGKSDCLLIKRLQKIYNKNFRIRQGNGSTPEIILNQCLEETGSFDIRFCVLDGDKIFDKILFQGLVNSKKESLSYELMVVVNQPCIEAVNLALLFGDDSGFNKSNCGVLKSKLKEKITGLPLVDFYDEKITKKLVEENLKLFEGRDFKLIIDLFLEKNHFTYQNRE